MAPLATRLHMQRLHAGRVTRAKMGDRQDDLPLGPLGGLMIALDTPAWPWVSAM